jgi:hypothetical protein
LVLGAGLPAVAAPKSHPGVKPTAHSSAHGSLSTRTGLASSKAAKQGWQGLAQTPPMGWNDWSYYQCNINEKLILRQARALVDTGLAAKGYDTVTTDDCWMTKNRDADGNLQVNKDLFPHGMAYIGRKLHKLGLKFGIYEDAGTKTCGGYAGSWDHFQKDADLFAKWKVDYLKLDGCNVPVKAGQDKAEVYRKAYKAMSDALVNTGRPIVFSESAPAYFQGTPDWHDVIRWSAKYGNLWREGADIALGQASSSQMWDSVAYNYSYNVGLDKFAGPGHWNDPDFLLVGDDPLTDTEAQSQMTLWAEMAAPLNSSTDLTKLTKTQLNILGNKRIIAIDQDPLGAQGHRIESADDHDILNKPLANGDRSVVLFNKSNRAQTLSVTTKRLGLTGHYFTATNLVSGHKASTTGRISANVPAHGTRIFRVHPGRGARLGPLTSVSVTSPESIGAKPTTVNVSLENDGAVTLRRPSFTLDVPTGWSVKPEKRLSKPVQPHSKQTVSFRVTAKTKPAPGEHTYKLTATAEYTTPGRTSTRTGEEDVVLNTPYPNVAAAYDNVGVTSDDNYRNGNLDGQGDSYSANAVADEAGIDPGDPIKYDNVTFTWPDVSAGKKDNVQAEGQIIKVNAQGSKLNIFGTEVTGAPAPQPFRVTYADGTTDTVKIATPNWLNSGEDFGQTTAIHTDYRNTPDGPANHGLPYDVYANSANIDTSKKVESVTLPDTSTFHIFDLKVK